jgi:putative hydrolase of the HAD superfamily
MTPDKAQPTVLWDFDGTLARGPRWSRTMMRVLDEDCPGHGVTREQLIPFLSEGFPWHNPERYHPELCSPEAWWAHLESLLARVYEKVGFSSDESKKLAQQAHELQLDPSGYVPFDETVPALKRLCDRGWQHIVLTNNFPELEDLLNNLPISDFIDGCICSGVTGYEKPNEKAFSIALEYAGNPERVWMVGDNIRVDVRGAEAMGIPAIFVRRPAIEEVKYHAEDLLEAASIIENSE